MDSCDLYIRVQALVVVVSLFVHCWLLVPLHFPHVFVGVEQQEDTKAVQNYK